MLAETGPDARVVVFPNMHPIFRRDVFYAWFSTWDPGGRGQEQIMAEWDPLGYGERFRREGYLADLDRNPPDLLLKKGKGYQLPPTQSDIVDSYMAEHAGEYREVGAVGDLVVVVRPAPNNQPIPRRDRHTTAEAVSPRQDRVEE